MTAVDVLLQIELLQAERLDAFDAGLQHNETYMAELEADLADHQVAYIGLAVTEIATLRAELGDANYG